jgi:hypothetical protein
MLKNVTRLDNTIDTIIAKNIGPTPIGIRKKKNDPKSKSKGKSKG